MVKGGAVSDSGFRGSYPLHADDAVHLCIEKLPERIADLLRLSIVRAQLLENLVSTCLQFAASGVFLPQNVGEYLSVGVFPGRESTLDRFSKTPVAAKRHSFDSGLQIKRLCLRY